MNMNMERSLVQLQDLPDEILTIILRKLCNVEVFYSLIGVNERLNRLAHDSMFTNHLSLMASFPDGSIGPVSDTMLDRFCSQILPQIDHKIQWFDIELCSMERILLSGHYPNLSGLGLYNFQIERVKQMFTNEPLITDLFQNQISSLLIRTRTEKFQFTEPHVNALILTDIFTMFTNLKYLNFSAHSYISQRVSFDKSPPTFISSTLLELHVDVERFTDCLYLLDGRFNQLQVLHINMSWIRLSSLAVDNTKILPNLRCFTLYCNSDTSVFDELVIPLLHRMSNLEKLGLYLTVNCKNAFINGNHLKRNIINHMPRLKEFVFNIRSMIYNYNQSHFLSHADIQHTFDDFRNNRIISYVDYFSEIERAQCHIYTYPYRLKEYNAITNSFPEGRFNCVCEISLFDERPFEHEFFLRIAQSFPFVQKLTLVNEKPQNAKRFKKSEDDNQCLSITKYSHLTHIVLFEAHDDYVEQFLLDTKTCLSNNVNFFVDREALKRVTHDFTREATRINCTKLRFLGLIEESPVPEYIKQYFHIQ